jgi:hypothetical protein
VLLLWEKLDAFQTSLRLSKDKPAFTFYDGPPFATGLPHYGHILAGTIKDIVTRYATQTGHYVSRRCGGVGEGKGKGCEYGRCLDPAAVVPRWRLPQRFHRRPRAGDGG